MLYQFGAVEDGLFELVGKFERVMRTGIYAQLAEDATAQVIDIVVEHPFGFPVFGLDFLGDDLYGVVGAVHLTNTARDTFVLTFGVEFERKSGSETVGNMQRLTILGILLGHFRRNKLGACYFHANKKTPQTFPEIDKVIF